MWRPEELVDWRYAGERVAAVDEYTRISGKGRGGAGDGDDAPDFGKRQLLALRFGAGTGRVDGDGVEGVEFAGLERAAEEVAALGGDGLQTLRVAGGGGEGRDRVGFAVEGCDGTALREGEGERSAA